MRHAAPRVSRSLTMRTWFVAIVLFSLSGAGLGAAMWGPRLLACDGGLCPGVRVAGETLPPGQELVAWLDGRARALAARPVELTVQGTPVTRRATLGELGVEVDVASTSALAAARGREDDLVARFHVRAAARDGDVDVPLRVDVAAERLAGWLAPLRDEVDEAPVPARLDLEHHAKLPHEPGRYLDLDGARERVLEAALAAAAAGAPADPIRVELPRVEVPPRISTDLIDRLDIDHVLARFETRFSRAGDQASRARNIDRAAARLDGTVLMPGEVVSFNALVGPRTVENGFSKGWEIFKGELVEGIGGGTCQVASTFHAAAYLAGLDVIERLPHSRPSAYITMGLDSTVVYPMVDLKVRNPWSFPVVVHSKVGANTVAFELLGHERPAEVTFGREVVGSRPYPRKVEETPGLAADRIVRKQHGIRGYTVRRTRTLRLADGTARVDQNTDVYPPTTEIYLVAPGTDAEAVLPPLPETPGSSPAEESSPRPSTDTLAATCTGECARPRIVDQPGAHAPTAEQARAPASVFIRAQR